jgi:hypothetical protein
VIPLPFTFRLLAKRDVEAALAQPMAPIEDTPAPARPAPEIFAPVPKSLRESAELPL